MDRHSTAQRRGVAVAEKSTKSDRAYTAPTAREEQQERDRQRRLAGKRIIDEQARRQVRTFLDELKNGTRNYRTVASLGGQVAQEYRGRAILELLQNAHDVLAFGVDDDPRRISFVLRSSPEPELLVANSGRPFLPRDFTGICELAQSPKDPNESVGNKGLGFQSVLELSTRPEVWSTAPPGGDAAFTFGFDPAVREPIGRIARALVGGYLSTDPEFGTERIVDWTPEQIDGYREQLRRDDIDPLEEVNTYLSPYVVPRFLKSPPKEVTKLLEAGHVTVVRLPLDGGKTGNPGDAIKSVREQLGTLDEAAMVFLHHLSVLRITIDEEHTELTRQVDSKIPSHAQSTRKEQLRVKSSVGGSDATERTFHLWSRAVGGDANPAETERIVAAVRHLPNRWPEVRRVEVAVAVEETREARRGVFVIFLPTAMKTGVGAHINAPFYGSLDRRQINFRDEYNNLLLEWLTNLMLDAVVELVKGPPEPWRGRAIIDLLGQAASSPTTDQAQSLADRVRQRADDLGRPLDQLALILCDDGWHLPGVARMMPAIPDDDPIGRAEWRKQAGFTVASSALDERRAAVEALLRTLGGSPLPQGQEWALTLQRLARQVSERHTDAIWNDFLSSILAVLPAKLRSEPKQSDTDPLLEATFLPTEDGRLLSAYGDAQLFFRPRRGADDAADFVGSIPGSLKPRIAFLHPSVKTHQGTPQRNTDVQKFLDGRFVQSFRREDLLRDVVLPSLPELPAKHGSPEAAACADVLRWTLSMIGQEEQESLHPLLARLPVACVAGWFAMRDAVFGPGWDGRCGDPLKTLADGLPDGGGDRLLRSALLPPDDPRWSFGLESRDPAIGKINISNRGDVFESAGVAEGLRLEPHESVPFWMSGSHAELPENAPATIPQLGWDDWRDVFRAEVNPGYAGEFEYEVKDIKQLPIVDLLHRDDIADPARRALADLILASLTHWEDGWEKVTIKKRKRWPWSQQITSPLKHWLSTLPWLDDGHDGRQKALRHRWLVPASLLRGPKGRFRHLSPLPLPLAYQLAEDEKLLRGLERLGLNVYPTEDALTGPSLLNALADVAAKAPGAMPAGGFDVFLGQVRQAWRHLDPDQGLPERFVVRPKPRTFEVRTAAELKDVYLPDHSANTRSLREHGQPILAIRPVEANGNVGDRLYDEVRVRRASTLKERCLIDGLPASEATEGAQGLDAMRLRWLPVVLLTLAAHGGANPRGPATDAWQEAAARLRRVRVCRSRSIAVELVDEGRIVASSKPRAHWLSGDNILLLDWEIVHRSSYEDMAAACQAALDRQDLLKDLRLVLGSLAGEAKPTARMIDTALDRAEIDAETVADIRHRWDGETSQLLARIRPVLQLLDVCDADIEAAATDTMRLAAWLSDKIPGWSGQELLTAARECYDDFEMGFRAWDVLREAAELPKWNAALQALGGEYAPVKNARAKSQAQRHLEEAAPSLRALARQVAMAADGPVGEQAQLFAKINNVHEHIEADADWPRLCEEWSSRWWKVPLGVVLGAMRPRYERFPAVMAHVEAFEDIETIDEFKSVLETCGVTLEPDPLEVAGSNRRRLDVAIRKVRAIHRAWLKKGGVDSSQRAEAPERRLDASVYLRKWTEAELFQWATRVIVDREFLRAVTGCVSIDEMRVKLDLSPEDVEHTTNRDGRGTRKKHRTFEIAGKDFEVGGVETYGELYDRLNEELDEPSGPRADLDEFAGLVVGSNAHRHGVDSKPSNGNELERPGRKTANLHPSPFAPELVGIVGEIHAFRFLRSKFDNITADAWVSEFRTKVLPLPEGEKDKTSDSLGYDFRFIHDATTWCVEVKATTEDATSFDLSSGEVAAASRIAPRKDERWRILRVRRALSAQPEFDWLPNPFEPGASQHLQMRQGGMTVAYTLSRNGRRDG